MSARRALPATTVFGSTASLPRGPHRLGREKVRTSQRTRLLAAFVDLVAERGYADTTITAVARLAGVSPNVFYEHFPDRESCFLSAYDDFAALVLDRLHHIRPDPAGFYGFILAMLDAYFGFLEDEPAAARAFLIEFDAAGPRARARRHATYAKVAGLLREQHEAMRRHDPSLGPLPERAFLGFVHAARELACDLLEQEQGASLRSLVPDLAIWVAASVAGASAAASGLTARAK
jgi:AcrR family transcriptional regulator